MKSASVAKKFRHFGHQIVSRITKHQYRALLMIAGLGLYIVHRDCPDYEITATLVIHTLVTLDPTV